MSTVIRQDAADLALFGGEAALDAPLPPWPVFAEDEIRAAKQVLESGLVNYWTGDECRRFETEFAAYHGVPHAVALANGTLALELGLRVLGVGPGDEVIVTARSYFASASSIAMTGARPVFADVDRDTQNITVESIVPHLTSRTKAIMAVHLAGWPCDMPAIMEFARARGLKVIEDCAQAHGAGIAGRPVGSFGDVAAFSFCQDKIMTTAGEGGMLITGDDELWRAAWSFKDHGKNLERVTADDHSPGYRWVHETVGSNYRMAEFQGAVGRVQLRKLDDWVDRRRRNAAGICEALRDLNSLRIPVPADGIRHSYYKLYIFVRPQALRTAWSRDRILAALDAEGVPGLSGSCPEIYREKAFATADQPVLPVAHELGETSIMLMVHPTLGDEDIARIGAAVRKVMASATA